MRREQVLKICLNHSLNTDIIYTPKEDKSWMFAANDFSEGELSLQQFCLRFKTKDIAIEFREAIDNAREGKVVALGAQESDASDDVVFVTEIQATKEEKQRAKELMLPENFFTYKNNKPCQGCRGCENKEDAKSTLTFSENEVTATPVKNINNSFFSPATSTYGTPNDLNKTVDSPIFRTPMDTTLADRNSTPIFGFNYKNKAGVKDKENVFAPKSIFGKSGDCKSISGTVTTSAPTTKSSILAAPKLSADILKESEKNTNETSMENTFASGFEHKPFCRPNPSKSVFSIGESVDSKTGAKDSTVFGSPGTDPKTLFRVANSLKTEPALFGSQNNNGGQSIFAQNTPSFSKQSAFGNIDGDNKTKPEVKSLFGGDVDQKPANLFSFQQGSLFGPPAPAADQNKPASSVFGSAGTSIFGNSLTNAAQTFGNAKPVFPPADQLIGDGKSGEKSIFGSNRAAAQDEKDTILKMDSNLSFAALSPAGPGFKSEFRLHYISL